MKLRRSTEIVWAPPFGVVPIVADGVYYCAVRLGRSGIQGVRQALRRSGPMVLLEFAPQAVGARLAQDTLSQSWPSDVARYSAGLGLEPEFRGGIPMVRSSFLSVYESTPIDYMTVGILSGELAGLGTVTEWERFRKRLQRDLLPNRWKPPAGCEAVLHVAGHEVAVVLSDSATYAVGFVGSIMLREALGEEHEPALWEVACETTAKWLLTEVRGTGARVERLRIPLESDSETTLTVYGRRGRGRSFHWSVGDVEGDQFVVQLPLGKI